MSTESWWGTLKDTLKDLVEEVDLLQADIGEVSENWDEVLYTGLTEVFADILLRKIKNQNEKKQKLKIH